MDGFLISTPNHTHEDFLHVYNKYRTIIELKMKNKKVKFDN